MRRTLLLAVAMLVPTACVGTLVTEAPSDDDAGIVLRLDSSMPLVDSGVPPGIDAGIPPGVDAGPPPMLDSGPPPGPCVGVTCGANSHCDPALGACRCDAGFVDMGGGCVAPPPGDPATRTQTEVCDAWRAGHVENASPAWTAGATMCDPGTMATAAIDDTLRRVNMFRDMAGLPAVSHDASRHSEMMECANMMNVNNALSHTPPTTWTCYSAGGASAAGRSNIALGYRTPGAAIDGYMGDTGTMSLGHRRWILSPRLGRVELGFAGRGQCLGVFDSSGSSSRPWTSYPNQGFAPIGMLQDPFGGSVITWSFQANAISLSGGSTVEVVRVSDGAPLTVSVYQTGGGGPPPSIAFTPMGWTPAAGQTYRVTITGTSAGDITYEVTLVSC
jgi:uncharacterized protein YkwD